VLEKAENGVSLAEDSRLQQTAEMLRQLEGAAVLGDYDAAETEKGRVAEEAEDAVVLIFFRRRAGQRRRNRMEGRWACAGGKFFEGAESVEREDLRFGLDSREARLRRIKVAAGA